VLNKLKPKINFQIEEQSRVLPNTSIEIKKLSPKKNKKFMIWTIWLRHFELFPNWKTRTSFEEKSLGTCNMTFWNFFNSLIKIEMGNLHLGMSKQHLKNWKCIPHNHSYICGWRDMTSIEMADGMSENFLQHSNH
jgi:hypothetical protein